MGGVLVNFKDKDEWKRWYEFAKKNKLCTNCGKEKVVKGRVRCVTCLQMNAVYQMNRRARLKMKEVSNV